MTPDTVKLLAGCGVRKAQICADTTLARGGRKMYLHKVDMERPRKFYY